MAKRSTSSTVAIIGGSGLYDLPGLSNRTEHKVETPFGPPSSRIVEGQLEGSRVLFLARHGIGHTFLPREVNYQANIYALKKLGASWCVSVSAVGSLREEIAPGHLVVPNQLIDRTKNRPDTFFGRGMVGHVPFGTPFCPVLQKQLSQCAKKHATKRGSFAHDRGTYVCIEGPAFSTRAESLMYRNWGADIIGMTALPEAKLAREAALSYANLALVTDYDCWRSEEAEVDVAELLKTLRKNLDLSQEILCDVIPKLAKLAQPPLVASASRDIVVTNPERIPVFVKRDLEVILGRLIR
jgi:5'-methylthioadenosine phosphorylase